jgi:hypothetical protein
MFYSIENIPLRARLKEISAMKRKSKAIHEEGRKLMIAVFKDDWNYVLSNTTVEQKKERLAEFKENILKYPA